MAKQSQLEKAIQNLLDKRAVLDLAIEQLEAQRKAKPAKAKKPQLVGEAAS